jgi:hypothetical protein
MLDSRVDRQKQAAGVFSCSQDHQCSEAGCTANLMSAICQCDLIVQEQARLMFAVFEARSQCCSIPCGICVQKQVRYFDMHTARTEAGGTCFLKHVNQQYSGAGVFLCYSTAQ